MHGAATKLLSVVLVVLGVALIVRTLTAGGGAGAVGVLLGALFVAVGVGRLWIAWRTG
ncbi:MAG TPA: hypothetical protein VIL49_05500 [Capillimicrobium sp.]|jgi:hypothetical protein